MSGPTVVWIQQASAVLESGPSVAATGGSAPLDVIDRTLDLWSLITGTMPHQFHRWIGQNLDSFRELLNDVTGDSAAIVAHARRCDQLATEVGTQVSPIATLTGRTPHWSGPAADGFARTMSATAVCVEDTAGAIRDLGQRHLALGAMVATVKQEIIRAVTDLAGRLVVGALEALARLGLAVSGGVVTLASGTVSGGLSGAADGFARGGLGGAVVGGISGGLLGRPGCRRRGCSAVAGGVGRLCGVGQPGGGPCPGVGHRLRRGLARADDGRDRSDEGNRAAGRAGSLPAVRRDRSGLQRRRSGCRHLGS